MEQTKQPLAKKILFSIVVILSFFIILEGFCRVAMSITKKNTYFLRYGYVYFKDLRPDRILSGKTKNADDEYGITVFGGSVAYGWDLERDQTFPYYLGQILNERLNTNIIAVSNKGAPGKTSHKNISDVLSSGDDNMNRTNRSRLYVIFAGINDACTMFTAATQDMRLQPDETMYNRLKLEWHKKLYFLITKTLLSISLMDDFLSRYALREKINNRGMGAQIMETQHKLPLKDTDTQGQIQLLLDRYRNNLLSIIEFCRFYGIDIIFGQEAICDEYTAENTLTGRFSKEDMAKFIKYYDMVYDVMKQVAKENNIIFVDTNSYFAKLPDSRQYFLYEDWCHHTPQGNRIVAELFADAIIKNRLIRIKRG